jgi:hypothetical protein
MDNRKQQEIVKLNQIGIELYQFHKMLAASFHFTEALRLLSELSAALEEEEHSCSPSTRQEVYKSNDRNGLWALTNESQCQFTSTIKLHGSLLKPLALDQNLPITQPETWYKIYALTVLHNIALTNYCMNHLQKAESTLRLALMLLNDKYQGFLHRKRLSRRAQTNVDDGEYYNGDLYSDIDLGTCIVLMSIFHMLGTVICEMDGGTLMEALDCYMEAFHAGRQLGRHVLVACVWVSIGSTFLRVGSLLEASYAYDMANCIYSTIQAGDTDGCLVNRISMVGCSGAAAA